MNVTKTKVY